MDFKNNEDMKNDSKLVALWIEYVSRLLFVINFIAC